MKKNHQILEENPKILGNFLSSEWRKKNREIQENRVRHHEKLILYFIFIFHFFIWLTNSCGERSEITCWDCAEFLGDFLRFLQKLSAQNSKNKCSCCKVLWGYPSPSPLLCLRRGCIIQKKVSMNDPQKNSQI